MQAQPHGCAPEGVPSSIGGCFGSAAESSSSNCFTLDSKHCFWLHSFRMILADCNIRCCNSSLEPSRTPLRCAGVTDALPDNTGTECCDRSISVLLKSNLSRAFKASEKEAWTLSSMPAVNHRRRHKHVLHVAAGAGTLRHNKPYLLLILQTTSQAWSVTLSGTYRHKLDFTQAAKQSDHFNITSSISQLITGKGAGL